MHTDVKPTNKRRTHTT